MVKSELRPGPALDIAALFHKHAGKTATACEDAMTYDLSCFKAYDIRGRVPDALNPDLARALGRAVADVLGARSVVLGRDARLSGPELRDALAQGLLAAGPLRYGRNLLRRRQPAF